MRGLCIAVVALVCALTLAPSAAAEEQPRSPKELWRTYPLKPKTQVATPVPSRPLRPPVGAVRPAADGRPGWILALALAAAGAAIVLIVVRPLATSRGLAVDRARRLRAHARIGRPTLRTPARARRRARPAPPRPTVAQYAPLSVVAPEPAAPEESVPYVTRRSGLVRSRYVVMLEEEGRTRELRHSRAFWQVGPEARQRRMAEDAWDALANDLRAEGWEVDASGRYEYFVPLRRAIISTLEPYTRFGRKGAPGR
jgi:hypothetical protein